MSSRGRLMDVQPLGDRRICLDFLAILEEFAFGCHSNFTQGLVASMSFDTANAGNAEEIEIQFAVKTVEHLEVCPVFCIDSLPEF